MAKGNNKKKNNGGRPLKQVDEAVVYKLAKIHCTMEEIASVVDCSVDTLERRFAEVIKKGKEYGKASLRRMQYHKAVTGDKTMLIWLGKQLLGQSDVYKQQIEQHIEVDDRRTPVDDLLLRLDAMQKRQDGKTVH